MLLHFNDLWLGFGNAASEMKSEFGFPIEEY